MSLALLFHYLMLNMFRMLIHPSSGACDLFVELFHYLMLNMFRMLIHPSSGAWALFVISWVVLLWFDACWCYVVVWLGWCGIRIPHHPSQTTT